MSRRFSSRVPNQVIANFAETVYTSTQTIQRVVQVEAGLEPKAIVSSINQTAEAIKISAEKLDLTGVVTIKGLEEGTTVIDGKVVTTGQVKSINYNAETHTGTMFNLDTGDLITNRGMIGGFEIKDGGFSTTEQRVYTAFTSTDVDYVSTLLGAYTPGVPNTQADLDKYDINRDGVVDYADYVAVKRIADGLSSATATLTAVLDPSNLNEMLRLSRVGGGYDASTVVGTDSLKSTNLYAIEAVYVGTTSVDDYRTVLTPNRLLMRKEQSLPANNDMDSMDLQRGALTFTNERGSAATRLGREGLSFYSASLIQQIRTGTDTIIGQLADGWTYLHIDYNCHMESTPYVYITLKSQMTTANIVPQNETETGFDAYLYGCEGYTVNFNWLAICQ